MIAFINLSLALFNLWMYTQGGGAFALFGALLCFLCFIVVLSVEEQ